MTSVDFHRGTVPTIQLETLIHAPTEAVFDLARDVEEHTASTMQTGEKAVAGRMKGYLELGDSVTWEARHFGIRQRLTVQITAMNRPHFFEDRMSKGVFSSMCHRHDFAPTCDGKSTLMKDSFTFLAPLGGIGRLAERMFLTKYMTQFLIQRNLYLKQMAEVASLRDLDEG